jgi:hypothetical protein
MADQTAFPDRVIKVGVFLLACIVLGLSILSRPDWKLRDFDQVFYVTIAYDLDRHGVFSDGIFDPVDSSVQPAHPGMFFGPVFPTMILAVMKADPRFKEAVRCSVDSNRGHRDEAACDAYETPIRLLNAALLALGVVAIGFAAELIFPQTRWIFAVTGLFATAALTTEAHIFSFVMTESAQFALYSVFAWIFLRGLVMPSALTSVIGGVVLGLLCLTKPSFVALFPIAIMMVLYFGYKVARPPRNHIALHSFIFILGFTCTVGPWMARNYVSVGKFGLTKEYGSAALIERFAYDDITPREFWSAFPYCTPGLGDLVFDKIEGRDSMHRFTFHTPGSFFHVGRNQRDALVRQHGELDPLIGGLAWNEMVTNWWRYLLTNIPLTWCGMWPGGVVTLLLLPLFVVSVLQAVRAREPLLLFYAAPAVLMLILHAAVGNHYTRYNLILIGPYSAGAAWIICSALPHARWRARFLASGS